MRKETNIVKLKDSLIYKTTLPVIILFTVITGIVFYKFYHSALSDGSTQATKNVLAQMNLTRVTIESSQELRDQQRIVSNLGTVDGMVVTALIDFNGGMVKASSRNAYIDKHSRILKRTVPDFESRFVRIKNGQCESINEVQYLCQVEIWAKPKISIAGRNLKEELLNLIVVYDISAHLSQAKSEFFYNSLFGFFAAIVLSIGLFAIVKQLILNRITELVATTERWSQGEKALRIQVGSNDELSFLAVSLNELMNNLREYEKKFADQQASVVHNAQLVALGEMAAGVAHEINNPLTIIAGKAQLIEKVLPLEVKSDERIKKSLESILNTVQRISKIINALRAYSRSSENDKFELVSVNQLVEDALSLCQERFRSNGVVTKYEAQGGYYVLGKDIQLVQVLVNLLNNSFDAVMKLEEKWIKIETHFVFGQIQIKVTDSGRGINPEIAAKIMQPFFTTKPVGQGTGIGLSISKGIVEEHGGQLNIDPANPHTCFIISLPLQESNRKVV